MASVRSQLPLKLSGDFESSRLEEIMGTNYYLVRATIAHHLDLDLIGSALGTFQEKAVAGTPAKSYTRHEYVELLAAYNFLRGLPAVEEKLHLGKKSGGWAFSLRVYPERGLNSLADWQELWQRPGYSLQAVGGGLVTPESLLQIIERPDMTNFTHKEPSRHPARLQSPELDLLPYDLIERPFAD